MAGNPLYLGSAGLLLYGINALTTDPRFVGAEYSMLQFNFCALVIYELILVITAIALARRKVWSDALLLIGLANLFVIIPFSLISRASYLSTHLALTMCLCGAAITIVKFWALKKYIPNLNLPRRLLWFGSLLLLVNSSIPMWFKAMAGHPEQIENHLGIICFLVIPILAGLGKFLPQPGTTSSSPEQKTWIPLVLYLGWIAVTAWHVLGVGYASGFAWSFSLLVPTAWAIAWVLYLRRTDFTPVISNAWSQSLISAPLLIPLLANNEPWMLLVLSGVNLIAYVCRFIFLEHSRSALVLMLASVTIFIGGLPMPWVNQAIPGIVRLEWIVCSVFLCYFWLVFRSCDPRVGFAVAVSVAFIGSLCLHQLGADAVQVGLVFLLIHSVGWDDKAHRGSGVLRTAAGLAWVLQSWFSVTNSEMNSQWLINSLAVVLMVYCGIRMIRARSWVLGSIPVYGIAVLAAYPALKVSQQFNKASPGFSAIAASFVLFALGSLVAFRKAQRKAA